MPLSFRTISCWSLVLICWGTFSCASATKSGKTTEKEASPPPSQTHRVEIESNTYDDEHWVHPLPDSTVLVISNKRNSWYSKDPITLTRYDLQLQPIWQATSEHKNGTYLHKVASDRKKASLLFFTREAKKLLLYQVDLTNGNVTSSEHTLPSSQFDVREIKMLQGKLFLYTLENLTLNMLLLDPAQEELRQLPAVFGKEDDLGEFRVDTLTNSVEFVVAESNGWRSRLQTKRMNAQGEVIGTYFLQPNAEHRNDNTLQTARLTAGDTLQKKMLGTYGYRTSVFARGLFSSDLGGNIKYFDFSQLKYFFDHTTPSNQKRLKAKFARQEAKGKPLVLRYRLLLHPVMPHPLGYALVGEVYYPQYRSNNYNTTTGIPNYGNSPLSRQIYDGFRFTHAIACVFDHQGNLLWDNSFELNNETFSDLAPTVEAGVTPDGDIALVYPKEEVLHFKTLKPNVSLTNEDKVDVRLQAESDKLISSEREGIVKWYGSNFLSFGFQRIKPENGPARTVFYLQAVAFE